MKRELSGRWNRGHATAAGVPMIRLVETETLSRDGLVAKLRAGHFLEEVGAGEVRVFLTGERVDGAMFAEFVQKRFVEETRPRWWGISFNGKRKLRVDPEKSG